MNAEYNKKLVEDMYVALNTKDLDAHDKYWHENICLLYTSPSPRDRTRSRMPSSA